MEDRFKRHGMFSWYELMTGDLEGSKKFYTELMGWTLEEFPYGGRRKLLGREGGRGRNGRYHEDTACS
jgi:predicted enzyme related to lactoylglutathione lyase